MASKTKPAFPLDVPAPIRIVLKQLLVPVVFTVAVLLAGCGSTPARQKGGAPIQTAIPTDNCSTIHRAAAAVLAISTSATQTSGYTLDQYSLWIRNAQQVFDRATITSDDSEFCKALYFDSGILLQAHASEASDWADDRDQGFTTLIPLNRGFVLDVLKLDSVTTPLKATGGKICNVLRGECDDVWESLREEASKNSQAALETLWQTWESVRDN